MSFLTIVRSLNARGSNLEIHLIVGSDGPLVESAQELGCAVQVLAFPGGLARLGDASLGALAGRGVGRLQSALEGTPSLWKARQYAERLRTAVDAVDPDVIYTNGLKMHALAVWTNRAARPVLWHIHDFVGLRPVMRRVLRHLAPGCTAAIANSESVAADLKRVCGQGLRVQVIYNAVDLDRFSPQGTVSDLDALAGMSPTPDGAIRIGLVSTMARWKGQEVFLRALAQLPADLNFRGYIIGGALYQTLGSQYSVDELRKVADRLGIGEKVGFTGFLEDPAAAMRSMDIVVHASTQPEPFGLVIVEAMACGRAVIASEGGGASEIIAKAGGAVMACQPGDARKLSACMEHLARDPELRASLGAAGRQACERHFNSSRLADEVTAVFEGALWREPQKSRILFLNPSGQTGGAEISLLNVIASLRERKPDWEIGLIAGMNGPLIAKAKALGVKASVVAFPPQLARIGDASFGRLISSRHGVLAAAKWIPSLGAALSYRRRLSREIRAFQPDLIHTNGFKMHALGILAGSRHYPVLWHIRDYVGLRPVMARVLSALAGRCAGAIANSESVALDLRKHCGENLHTDVIYNTVDLTRFSPQGAQLDLDRLSGLEPARREMVRVGLVGTMARWKGHEIFLKALSLLPPDMPIRGYVVGGPVYQTEGSQYSLEEVRGIASRLGLDGKIGFPGFADEPAAAIRALDIVVHASTKPEPFGLVIIEAMACGRAVIASNAGGAAEVLAKAGTDAAIPCPPNDPKELAKRIRLLAENRRLRESLGRVGRERAEQYFSCTRLADELISCYRRVLHSESGTSISQTPTGVPAEAID